MVSVTSEPKNNTQGIQLPRALRGRARTGVNLISVWLDLREHDADHR